MLIICLLTAAAGAEKGAQAGTGAAEGACPCAGAAAWQRKGHRHVQGQGRLSVQGRGVGTGGQRGGVRGSPHFLVAFGACRFPVVVLLFLECDARVARGDTHASQPAVLGGRGKQGGSKG